MKIYTRTGDDGSTGLIGGRRTQKDDPRIECYGSIDELNAHIGLSATVAPDVLRSRISTVQAELFVLGSHLASPDPSRSSMLPPLNSKVVGRLESEIDAAEQALPPLRNFILPGGTECAARLHVARTVCRRAERLVVQFARKDAAPDLVVAYLNRLSDWLFVHARLANHLAGVTDVPWKPEKGSLGI